MERLVVIPEDDLFMLIKKAVLEINGTAARQDVSVIPYEQPMTPAELASYLRTSVQTLIRWRKRGKIPYIKVGANIRFDRSAVVKALEGKGRK